MPLVGTFSGFTFRGVTVIGNQLTYATQYVHCIQIGNGNVSNILIDSSTFQSCGFALFSPSDSNGIVDEFMVRDSFFFNNNASDLEFNAPNSIMRNITVINTQFSNNKDPGPSAGILLSVLYYVSKNTLVYFLMFKL